MDHQSTTASPTNGISTPQELFALTDEQILEIEPEGGINVAPPFRAASSPSAPSDVTQNPQDSQTASQQPPATSPGSPEPPPWLAAQMKDPWTGKEAKEFWNGVQQAKQETAAYRAAFATPEDARALKELYPGGMNEARAISQRARILDDIDRAYFGAPGNSPEQLSAARAQLATTMMREDPAAFREMVFAGLRALEEAKKGSGAPADGSQLPRLAQAFAANRTAPQSTVGATLASPAADDGPSSTGGASPAPTVARGPLAANAASGGASSVGAQHAAPLLGNALADEAHVAAYAAFEKTANEDLERSVGAAIERTLQQALPNLQGRGESAPAGAQRGVPLQDRLAAAVRQDVEAALKGDRQLGEQIAQILSARRFDNETRARVVRLIDDRARQLVPSAAKRVINDWTQATLAAHRSSTTRTDVASRPDIEPALAPGNLAQGNVAQGESASPAAFSSGASRAGLASRAAQTRPGAVPHRSAPRSDARRLDYRKLSDEQILEL